MKTINTIKKVSLATLLTFVLSFSSVFAQNDTIYIMKSGAIVGQYNVNTEVDSIIFYKPTIEATTTGTFTDSRDDKVYQTVVIGNQEWMAEDLAFAPSSGNYWAYDNDDANVETYGYLYDWETACDVCPDGWHLPSDEEWKELETAIGMPQAEADDTDHRGTNEGSKLAGNAGLWDDGALVNDEDFETSGFTALPGGFRSTTNGGFFNFIGTYGYWWSATEGDVGYGLIRSIKYNHNSVLRGSITKQIGFSVRCLRD